MNNASEIIKLEEHELEIVKDVANRRAFAFDARKKEYSMVELRVMGIYRESYSIEELRERKFDLSGVVTSFDGVSKRAEKELTIDAPFAEGIRKWQLPIDVMGFRIISTVFPPNTTVLPHVHSELKSGIKSGGFRIVVKGSITFEGKKYSPGDWFFIPNGVPYTFTTDPEIETTENYWYGHNAAKGHSRISSPIPSN
ncbi:MAG: hypothetical protein JAY62_00670 [Candidatus Thiodiazotropha endolucinida]|nr:hypothetical protein [Candidatus Thiodiazotropha taylori]MCW4273609.1 hypothetical protein [Candidatus Thiodiazotropha taylori]